MVFPQQTHRGELTILNFHGIGEPCRDLEPGEAPFWLSRRQFVDILDRVERRADRDRFAITFDDSNISDLTIAVPELKKREMTAIFFVLTGRFGSRGSLGRSEVMNVAASGMEIGSHGIGHRDLTSLSPEEIDRELTDSRTVLEDALGRAISSVSIPFGRYNGRVLRSIRGSHYAGAYTSDGGGAYDNRFLRPRRSLRCDMTVSDIDVLLSGKMPVANRVRRAVSMSMKRLG